MGGSSGTVTFLFTDIEGSTRLWQADETAMRAAVARHDEVLQSVISQFGGRVFSTMGDGLAAVFPSAQTAVLAAQQAQTRLEEESWATATALAVRIGLHSGEAEEREGDYFGTAVNRAARLMAIGHGRQILCSSVTAGLIDGQASLVDLGEHRLRDLDRPMHVFQVGPGTFPPLRSLDAFPSNLPNQLTSFVGRDRELVLISKALAGDRLVTLTGTGGVGKTRLALQAGAEAISAFPDGVWLCELAVASDPESMLALVASALGMVLREQHSLVEGIAEFIGDRRLLVILDNCEHLLDAAAELAERLLVPCRRTAILATSREALDIPGERVLRLRSLEVPDPDARVDELTQTAASRLFLERAEAAGAGLELGEIDRRSIADICRRLDGIPLAIELAAARTIAMSPSEVADRLDERFRLLTGGRRATVERHQTLRATLNWSYSLLGPIERRVFCCLGVFPASFDAEAAQAVAVAPDIGPWDVVDALTSLVAKSMLGVEHTAIGSTRYQMLESLRQYAREHLEEDGEADAARRRHAQYFASFMEQFRMGVAGRDEVTWASRLTVEMENIRTAIIWGLDSAEDADGELALETLAKCGIGQSAGPVRLFQLAGGAVDRARRGDPRFGSVVLSGASLDAFYRGDLVQATALSKEALAGGLVPGTPLAGQGPLIARLIFAPSADVPALIADGHQQLEHLGASDWELAGYLGATASMAALRGHLDLARHESARGLEVARTSESPSVTAAISYAYGLAWWQAEPEAALEVLEQGLPAIRASMHEPLVHRALALLAQLRAGRGDILEGLNRLKEAVESAHACSDRQGLATVLARGVFVVHSDGRDDAAATLAGVVTHGLLKGLFPLPTHETPQFQELLGTLVHNLGPERYEHALRHGSELRYTEVVAFASEASRTRPTEPTSPQNAAS